MPPGDQAVFAQPEVPPGFASPSLPCTCGETFLPHRDETAENRQRPDQELLLPAGELTDTIFSHSLSLLCRKYNL